jgi:hypothetical protein
MPTVQEEVNSQKHEHHQAQCHHEKRKAHDWADWGNGLSLVTRMLILKMRRSNPAETSVNIWAGTVARWGKRLHPGLY